MEEVKKPDGRTQAAQWRTEEQLERGETRQGRGGVRDGRRNRSDEGKQAKVRWYRKEGGIQERGESCEKSDEKEDSEMKGEIPEGRREMRQREEEIGCQRWVRSQKAAQREEIRPR